MGIGGKRVFILGDSHSHGAGSLGTLFAQGLRNAGAREVRVNAKIGRSAHSFFRESGPSATEILASAAAGNPHVVYVVLGSNDTGLDLAVDARQFARIRDAFPNAEVWGIGPPTLPRDPQGAETVTAMMARVFGPNFIDLRPLSATAQRAPDRLHFTSAGAKDVAHKLTTVAVAKLRPRLSGGQVVKVGAISLGVMFLGVGMLKLFQMRDQRGS